ncbi:vWA domain-containing protein [Gottfriedia luciferensis]|uniref:vWA domain-containing protein n=1 Tax=Gottfriedia luciferensis TaxID=178774 RepID=UPI000B4349C0|nr:vWA domain-containing protein [Gottfriedia luciferensis]
MISNKTEIIFLLDRSGSMAGLERDTIGGFNAFIKKQSRLEGETVLTTVLFDNQYEVLWDEMKASEVKLTEREYFVRGTTALLDALGKTILNVRNRLSLSNEEDGPGKVIFVITTDGLENASIEFTYSKVKNLILHQQEMHNWEFIFMGANIDVGREADQLGILKENAYQFESTNEGVEKMYNEICEALYETRGK